MSNTIKSSLPNGKIFFAESSQLHERYDPNYIFHKLNTSLESKYRSARLSSIVNTFGGGTPSKNNPAYWDGDIPWISPKDFNGFNLFETEDKITEEGVKNSSTKIAPKNSIVIVVRSGVLAHTLPVCINRVPAAINQDLKILTPTTEKLLPEFLGYYFFTFGKKLLPLITKQGTTVHSINTEQFERLQIPVPPIHIQEKVISIYQQHFEARTQMEAEAEELLNRIDDYLLSELGIEVPEKDNSLENRIFTTSLQNIAGSRYDPFYNQIYFQEINRRILTSTYSTTQLKELCYPVRGVTYTSNDETQNETGVGILRANNINLRTNQLDFSEVRYLRENFNINSSKKLQKNDILMSAASGSKEHVGKVTFIKKDLPYYFGGFMSVLRVHNHKVLPKYLFYLLQSNLFRSMLFRVLGGTNINNLYFKTISEFPIILPDKKTQKAVIEELDEIRNKALQLEKEAQQAVEDARQQVEEMILEEDAVPA